MLLLDATDISWYLYYWTQEKIPHCLSKTTERNYNGPVQFRALLRQVDTLNGAYFIIISHFSQIPFQWGCLKSWMMCCMNQKSSMMPSLLSHTARLMVGPTLQEVLEASVPSQRQLSAEPPLSSHVSPVTLAPVPKHHHEGRLLAAMKAVKPTGHVHVLSESPCRCWAWRYVEICPTLFSDLSRPSLWK